MDASRLKREVHHLLRRNSPPPYSVEDWADAMIEALAIYVDAKIVAGTVYDEIRAERTKQDAEWGGPHHDDTHSIEEWVEYIHEHAGRAANAHDGEVMRYQMVRVAALAVAAIEALDRDVPLKGQGR